METYIWWCIVCTSTRRVGRRRIMRTDEIRLIGAIRPRKTMKYLRRCRNRLPVRRGRNHARETFKKLALSKSGPRERRTHYYRGHRISRNTTSRDLLNLTGGNRFGPFDSRTRLISNRSGRRERGIHRPINCNNTRMSCFVVCPTSHRI